MAMSWTLHKKYNTLHESRVTKLPDNVSLESASLFHIATFPLAAVRKTELEIGESMLVMGLGILGLMAVSLAHAAGATPVIAVDPIKERREKAIKFGADYAFDPFDPEFVEKVKNVTRGGANCAIEVTGLGAGLNQCLDCMAKFGRNALLGCTRNKNFTVDYYRKVHGPGITMIGAHTLARPKLESSPHEFTDRDDRETLARLASLGRIDFDAMIDEIVAPENCGEVFTRLINDSSFPPAVIFDWSNTK